MNGRHSAVKKGKRSTAKKNELVKQKMNKQEKTSSGTLNDNEIILNIPVSDNNEKKEIFEILNTFVLFRHAFFAWRAFSAFGLPLLEKAFSTKK